MKNPIQKALRFASWKFRCLLPIDQGYIRTWWKNLEVDDDESVASDIRKFGVYDSKMSWEIINTVKPGMTVLNIGANIGYMAMLAEHRGAYVHAFEPDPRSYSLLVRNCSYDTKCIRALVASYNETSVFWLDGELYGNSSISKENTKNAQAVPIRTITIDKYTQDYRIAKVDVVIIDVQGAEMNVFKGMINTIKNDRPVILLELWPFGLENCGSSAIEMFKFFYALGYRLEELETGNLVESSIIRTLQSQKNGKGFCNLKAISNI